MTDPGLIFKTSSFMINLALINDEFSNKHLVFG